MKELKPYTEDRPVEVSLHEQVMDLPAGAVVILPKTAYTAVLIESTTSPGHWLRTGYGDHINLANELVDIKSVFVILPEDYDSE